MTTQIITDATHPIDRTANNSAARSQRKQDTAARFQELLQQRNDMRVEVERLGAELSKSKQREKAAYQRGFEDAIQWTAFKCELEETRARHAGDFDEAISRVRNLAHASVIFAAAEKNKGGAMAVYVLGGRTQLLEEFGRLSAAEILARFLHFLNDLKALANL